MAASLRGLPCSAVSVGESSVAACAIKTSDASQQRGSPRRLVRLPLPGRLGRGVEGGVELLARALGRLGEDLARSGVADAEGGLGRRCLPVDGHHEFGHRTPHVVMERSRPAADSSARATILAPAASVLNGPGCGTVLNGTGVGPRIGGGGHAADRTERGRRLYRRRRAGRADRRPPAQPRPADPSSSSKHVTASAAGSGRTLPAAGYPWTWAVASSVPSTTGSGNWPARRGQHLPHLRRGGLRLGHRREEPALPGRHPAHQPGGAR